MPPETKEIKSKAQQALDALAKIEALKKEAIDELLAERQKIDEQLAQLGFAEGTPARKKPAAQRQKSEVCSICKFATEPPHDGRLRVHRDQGDNKKPLTDKQLAEAGLKKKA